MVGFYTQGSVDWLALCFGKALIWLQSEDEKTKGRDNNPDTITIVQMENKEALIKGSGSRNKKEERDSRGGERSLSYE